MWIDWILNALIALNYCWLTLNGRTVNLYRQVYNLKLIRLISHSSLKA